MSQQHVRINSHRVYYAKLDLMTQEFSCCVKG